MPSKITQRIPFAGQIRHVTYENAFQTIKASEQVLLAGHFDLIIGVARSGIVPATMLSQMIDVPLVFLQCGRTDPKPYFLTPIDIENKKVLIVDDIIGLGITMRRVVQYVKERGAIPHSFCLYYDKSTTEFIPDYGIPVTAFMHAQWDRKDITPKSRQVLKDKNGRCAPEDFTECYGTDLDGVFLDDINRKTYRVEERLQSILNYRDTLQPLSNLPLLDHEDVYIITARPEIDVTRTRAWLDRHGFSKMKLICRDAHHYGLGTKEAARFKADQILHIGISKFFESDLLQATLIATQTPCTDIYWWGKEDKLRIYANPVAGPFNFQESTNEFATDGN